VKLELEPTSTYYAQSQERASNYNSGQSLVNLDQDLDILRTDRASNLGMLQIAKIEEELGSRYSLAILRPLLEPDRIEGTFKRVGIVEVPILSGFAVKKGEIRTVMIV
jgi:hypothetical protein